VKVGRRNKVLADLQDFETTDTAGRSLLRSQAGRTPDNGLGANLSAAQPRLGRTISIESPVEKGTL
jgi:hypothetical protein